MTLHKVFIIQRYFTTSGTYKFICTESHKSEKKISEESEISQFTMLRLDKQSGNYVKENSVKYEITCAVKLIYY